ncbi:MAG: SlyX family protein [Pseudolabrys sp.]
MADIGPDIATLVRRIEALETDAAHRGRAVDDLNATITAQWKEIESLNRQVRRISDQLADVEARSADRGPEPPPPHY